MNFICLNYDSCGFFDKTLDVDLYHEMQCPQCGTPLVKYRSDKVPNFVKAILTGSNVLEEYLLNEPNDNEKS